MTSPSSPRWLPLFSIAALAMSAAPGSSAWAQSDDASEQAKELFKRGEKLSRQQRFKEAAEAFARAYEISNQDELLRYMGEAYESAGEIIAAQRAYRTYLDNVPDAPNREAILDKVLDLQQRIVTQMGRLDVSATLEQSEVFVNEEPKARCLSPCTVALKPGEAHTLRLVDPQGREGRERVEVSAGERREVEISTEPRIARGVVLITTDLPSATLSVDGERRPLGEPLTMGEGNHEVTLRAEPGRIWRGQIEASAERSTTLSVPLAHLQAPATAPAAGTSTKRVGAALLSGGGAGALLGGALLGRQARSTHEALEARAQRGAPIEASLIEQGRSQQRGANILMIGGGLALLTGVGLFTWDWLDRSEREPAPEPSAIEEPVAQEPAPPPPSETTPRVPTLD